MKLTVLTAVVAGFGFTLAQIAFADTYRTEISLNYSEFHSDYYDGDNYSISLEGTQYFSPVDTRNVPLAEAAFLGKASSFSFALGNYDYEYQEQGGDDYVRNANVTYFIPNSIFFIGAGVSEHKSVFTHRYYEDYWQEGEVSMRWRSRWSSTVGIAPSDGLQLWSEFLENVAISDYWNLNAKYVKPLVGDRALSVGARYSDDKEFDISSVTVSADFYFTHHLSVGAGITHAMSDSYDMGEDNPHYLRAQQFITENTSVEVIYIASDYSSSWQLSGTVRF